MVADEVMAALKKLETAMGKKLGDPDDPLLVSVRSGAPVSMPGMMDRILNLGINDKAVIGLANKTGNPRFAWDAYRRFIQMYGDVVMGVEHDEFEHALAAMKQTKKVELDTGLNADDLKNLVDEYKKIVKKHAKKDFPQDPVEQMWGAANAVFGSWMNERAIKYRQINEIRNVKGTAVNIQSMVFGNFGDDSGTGVCFSRDPSTGVNVFYGGRTNFDFPKIEGNFPCDSGSTTGSFCSFASCTPFSFMPIRMEIEIRRLDSFFRKGYT